MCLQDLQIQRAILTTVVSVTGTAGNSNKILESDDSRVGFTIAGPSSGSVGLRVGSDNIQSTIGHYLSTNTEPSRVWNIWKDGPLVTDEFWLNFSANATVIVLIYTLPMDSSQLTKLANQGKF